MSAIRLTKYVIKGQDSAHIYCFIINIYHVFSSAVVHQHYKRKVPLVAFFRMTSNMLFM